MATIGGTTRPGNSGTLVGTVAGFAVGVLCGVFGPRLLHHRPAAPTKPATAKNAIRPNAATLIQLTAQPAQHGLLISSSGAVQLSTTGHSKLARQEGQAVF